MPALVTVTFVVSMGYQLGDYAMFHGSEADGEIDWNNPLSERRFDLFPNGAGIFGWGHAPWGNFRWGHAHSMRAAGWGELPWGRFPWGYGTAVITAKHTVVDCGVYKFGFACYDELGNLHSGSPEELEIEVHTAPPAPAGLKKTSYNKTTDVLVLNVVS